MFLMLYFQGNLGIGNFSSFIFAEACSWSSNASNEIKVMGVE